jgi:glycosyltransferase involved in cell wall biosynthesis
MTDSPSDPAAIRVLHVVSRLNIGGAAIQVISLTRLLNDRGYDATLLRGTEDESEGTMDYLAEQLDVRLLHVPSLRRSVGWGDIRAFVALFSIMVRVRPDVVHTHAAKGGMLGRLAASVAPGKSDRVLVHTFHGHSLSGYFSPPANKVFLAIERFLARLTTRLVAVSEEVRDDLVNLKVAGPKSFEVIRCGFDFSPFLATDLERGLRRGRLRAELAIPSHARLVTLIARLAPIKRVDRFLRLANMLVERGDTYFLVVGDGELRGALQASRDTQTLGERLIWTGFRRDIADICFASDLIVLTSDNEGTPISLIEALAAGTPVVSTDVGGVSAVVINGETGLIVAPDDERGLAEAATRLLDDDALARRLAQQGSRHVLASFGLQRLVDDHDRLYRRLLFEAGVAARISA